MVRKKSKHTKLINFLLLFSLAFTVFAFSFVNSNAAAKTPEYIAHRGWSTRAPENTLPAFRLAVKNKVFYGVEFDIWESSAQTSGDPLLLVMHDENIQRMCGVNKSIRKITRKSLGKYTIISGSKVNKYPNLKIPTADEALRTIWENSSRAIPVIELKHRLSDRAMNYLFDLIGDNKVVIISFEYNAVTDAVKMAKKRGVSDNVKTMYLLSKLPSGKYKSTARKLKRAGIDCISLKYTGVTKRTVKAFHKQGIKVCTWTVPNKKAAGKLAGMGVDYITANGKVY